VTGKQTLWKLADVRCAAFACLAKPNRGGPHGGFLQRMMSERAIQIGGVGGKLGSGEQ